MPTTETDMSTLQEPKLTDIAVQILNKRYLVKDDEGNVIETPKDMFWRVASSVAAVESKYGANEHDIVELARSFYYMMSQGYWLPNSPTLMNAGRPLGQLSACFVLPVEDSLTNGKDGIYDTLTNMAKIHQSGGGTGFSFNSLRPGGSVVKSTTGVASGPVSFMSLYDASTDVVKQGGTRRGANMGILRVDHPDILDFIDCKKDTTKINNFNISVAITTKFMESVGSEGSKSSDYDLVYNGEVCGQLNAGMVWDKICDNAWASGEPGLFFVDEANYWNPVPHLGEYEATNPCAEQPLLPYDVCNLGSINLGKFVEDQSSFIVTENEDMTEYLTINWEKLDWITALSVRFLDNVIDLNAYPLPEIRDRATSLRRIGNGVMGFADMLTKLKEPYGSERSMMIASIVSQRFVAFNKVHSEKLAESRGTFPEWERSIHGPNETCAMDKDGQRISVFQKQRHCNVTTVAPTGTISMIAGCSGGIEPLYGVVFNRRQAGLDVVDVNENFKKDLDEYEWGSSDIDTVLKMIADKGDIDLPIVPKELRDIYKTSATVTPEQHVDMQAKWQAAICSGISKTINLPNGASVNDVRHSFERAYNSGCKGVTVYRDGSRPLQVLSTIKTGAGDGGSSTQERDAQDRTPARRPECLDGATHKIISPVGEMFVTVNRDEFGDAYEVFVTIGKAGGTANSFGEACARLISLCLRSGIPIKQVYKQLKGISSDRAVGVGGRKVLSGPDAVAIVLKRYMETGEETVAESADENGHQFAACPDCGADLVFSEGCYTCVACGHNGCS